MMGRKERILAIGPLSDLKRNRFSGQSIMFDGTVSAIQSAWDLVYIINIFPSKDNCRVTRRLWDYVKIICLSLIKSIQTRRGIAYVTSSLGKPGVYRDLVLLMILRMTKHRVVLHQFGADISGLVGMTPLMRHLFSRAMNNVSSIIIEGDYIEQLFSSVPEVQGKLIKIPNGLPIEGKNARKPKMYNGAGPFKLFYLSNLIYSKGWFDVLQAVNILAKHNRDIECLFVGRFMSSSDDGSVVDFKKLFADYVADNDLAGIVNYLPGLFGEEKDSAFLDSNAFLLPSYYVNEGQPVSILEAMSYGCVPIVTNYRHIPMMITEENGCFVKPKSPEDIAAAVCELMDYPERYRLKSEKCISDYQRNFTFEAYTKRIVDMIGGLN